MPLDTSWIMKNTKNKKIFFEKLFSEYSDVIYRLALYKTDNSNLAHEITQETFLRVWKTILLDKEISNPKSYIYQITRNLITDNYRKTKESSLDKLVEDGFDYSNNKAEQSIKTDISLLRSCINNLDEIYREPIYLKYVEGYRVKEIAKILDVSENVISVRINRATKQLQDLFSC